MKIINIVYFLFTMTVSNGLFLALVYPMPGEMKGFEIVSFILALLISFVLVPQVMFRKFDSLIKAHEDKIRKEEREKTIRDLTDFIYDTRTEDPEFFRNVMSKDVPIGGLDKGIATVYNRVVGKIDEYLRKG